MEISRTGTKTSTGAVDVGEVGPDGGGAADQNGDAGAGLGVGDDVVAEPAEQRGGLHRLGAGGRVEVSDGDPAVRAEHGRGHGDAGRR
jgi:hypothetical protein